MKRLLTPERILDLALRFGPYGDRFNPFSSGLSLRKVRNAVHGLDLGPLKPCLPARLRTSDKRIELAPEVFVADLQRVKAKFFAGAVSGANGHLLLIGRRHLRSNNSWMHNIERLVKGNPAKPRCSVLMHPTDAANRGLKNGESVRVQSTAGSIVLPVTVTDEMMPGVVSIPHGWSSEQGAVSINDVTDNQAIDALCGTAAFNGTPVLVEAEARVPEMAEFASQAFQ